MTTNISRAVLNLVLSMMSGSVFSHRYPNQYEIAVSSKFEVEDLEIPANTGLTPVTVQLGGLTAPKWLIVYGGTGISFTVGTGVDSHDADPICVLSKKTGLVMSPAEISVSNSSTSPVRITVRVLQ